MTRGSFLVKRLHCSQSGPGCRHSSPCPVGERFTATDPPAKLSAHHCTGSCSWIETNLAGPGAAAAFLPVGRRLGIPGQADSFCVNGNMGFMVVGFLVSGAGFVLLSYGRKMQRPPQLITGLVLLILPYVVPSIAWLLAATVGTVGLMWVALARDL